MSEVRNDLTDQDLLLAASQPCLNVEGLEPDSVKVVQEIMEASADSFENVASATESENSQDKVVAAEQVGGEPKTNENASSAPETGEHQDEIMKNEGGDSKTAVESRDRNGQVTSSELHNNLDDEMRLSKDVEDQITSGEQAKEDGDDNMAGEDVEMAHESALLDKLEDPGAAVDTNAADDTFMTDETNDDTTLIDESMLVEPDSNPDGVDGENVDDTSELMEQDNNDAFDEASTLDLDEDAIMSDNEDENNQDPNMGNDARDENDDTVLGNMCLYKCPDCDFTHPSWKTLKTHLFRTKHSGNSENKNAEKLAVKIVRHKCRICDVVVLNDLVALHNHVKRHMMKLAEYCQDHNLVHKGRLDERRNFHVANEEDVKSSDLSVSPQTDSVVGNLCLFKCPQCGMRQRSWGSMTRHFANSGHNKDFSCRIPEKCAVKLVKHECRVCKTLVLNDGIILTHHVYKHNMKLRDYVEKYGLVRQKSLSTAIDEKEAKKGSDARGDKTITYDSDAGSENFVSAKVDNAVYDNEVGTLCEFKCPKCHMYYQSYQYLKKHFRKVHVGERMGKAWECATELVLHRCRICEMILINDPYFYNGHLYRHGLNKEEYNENFGDMSDPDEPSRYDSNKAENSGSKDSYKKRKTMIQESTKQEEIGNFCTFQCVMCHESFNSFKDLNSHIKTSGHASNSRKKLVDYLKTATYHKCNICDENLLCDLSHLKRHLTLSHKTDLEQYCDDHNVVIVSDKKQEDSTTAAAANERIDCRESSAQDKQRKESERAMSLTSVDSETSLSAGKTSGANDAGLESANTNVGLSKDTESNTEGCDVDGNDTSKPTGAAKETHADELAAAAKDDNANKETAATAALVEPSDAKLDANLCIFSCPKCEIDFDNNRLWKIHVGVKSHNWEDGIPNVKDCLKKVVHFKCKICDKKVLQDVDYVNSHLATHELTAEEYMTTENYGNYDTVEVSKDIGYFCVFTCTECDAKFESYFQMMRHFTNTKHMQKQDGDARSMKSLMTKRVYHECVLCFKEVICDHKYLFHHFKSGHKLNIEQYCQKTGVRFMKKVGNEFKVDLSFGKGAKFVVNQGNFTKEEDQKTVEESLDKSSIKNILSKTLGNRCRFRCKICGNTFNNYSKVMKHQRLRHIKAEGKILKQGKRYEIVKQIDYKCRICAKMIPCDLEVFRHHLQTSHKMTSCKIYCRETGERIVRRQEVEGLEGDDLDEHSSEMSMSGELQANSSSELDDNTLSLQDVVARDAKANPCVKRSVFSKELGNRCTFKCAECNELFDKYRSLTHHFNQTKHCEGTKNVRRNFITKAVWHRCRVCLKQILSDEYYLKNHIGYHKLTLPEYQKTYWLQATDAKLTETSVSISQLPGDHCKFKCTDCHRLFESYCKLIKHFESTKHAKGKRRIKKDFMVKEVRYRCKICSSYVLSDRIYLRTHLKNKHKISVAEYLEKHADTQDEEDCEEVPENTEVCKKFEDPNEGKELSDMMANLCVFNCPDCENDFDSHLMLRKHFKNHGHGKGVMFVKKKCLTKSVFYQCRLCSKLVLCDKFYLRKHFEHAHEIGVKEYCKRVQQLKTAKNVCKTKDEQSDEAPYDSDACEDDFDDNDVGENQPEASSRVSQWNNAVTELRIGDADEKSTVEAFDQAVVSDVGMSDHDGENGSNRGDQVTNREITNLFNRSRTRTDFTGREKESKTLGNRCLFKCPDCQETFQSHVRLTNHFSKTNHGKKVRKNIRKHCMTITVVYSCKLCNQKVLCDNFYLGKHLINWHSIGIREYVRQIQQKSGINESFSLTKSGLRGFTGKEKISAVVDDFCLFKCPKCKKTVNSYVRMKGHLRSSGHGKGVESIQKDCVTKRVFYKCRLCQTLVLCDRDYVSKHLYTTHKIGRTEYFKRIETMPNTSDSTYNEKLQEEAESDTNKDSNHADNQVSNSDNSVVNESVHAMGEVAAAADDVESHANIKDESTDINESVDIDVEGVDNDETVIEADGTLPRSEDIQKPNLSSIISEKVGNLCTFSCKVCDKKFNNCSRFENHLEQTGHAQAEKQGLGEYKMTKKVIHQCKLCQEFVLCDVKCVKDHLRAMHRMEIEMYYMIVGPPVKQEDKDNDEDVDVENANEVDTTELEGLNESDAKVSNVEDLDALADPLETESVWINEETEALEYDNTSIHNRDANNENDIKKRNNEKRSSVARSINDCSPGADMIKQEPKQKERSSHMASNKNGKDVDTTRVVGNFCVFQCRKCRKEFSGASVLQNHLRSNPTCKGKGRRSIVNDYLKKSMIHECKICSEDVICDLTYLRSHVYQKHDLDVAKYCEVYGLRLERRSSGNQYEKIRRTRFERKESENAGSHVSSVARKSSRRTDKTPKKRSSGFNNTSFYCDASSYETKTENSETLGNKCVFECVKCKEEFNNLMKLQGHLKATNHAGNGPRKIMRDYLKKASHHQCQICGKNVLCDSTYLRNHMVGHHKMTLRQYCSDHNLEYNFSR